MISLKKKTPQDFKKSWNKDGLRFENWNELYVVFKQLEL